MLKLKVVSLSLGLMLAISFVTCIGWGLVMPESLHMHRFLELVLPGFGWLSGWSFVLGVVESFLFGVYFGLIYVPIYNVLHRRWSNEQEA